jgi:hypothetical protein
VVLQSPPRCRPSRLAKARSPCTAVFKKFEKENLFQIACADIVERFQLCLMLSVIAFRNLIELSGSDYSSLPTSMSAKAGSSHIWTILSPVLVVLGSECVVDWMKHA